MHQGVLSTFKFAFRAVYVHIAAVMSDVFLFRPLVLFLAGVTIGVYLFPLTQSGTGVKQLIHHLAEAFEAHPLLLDVEKGETRKLSEEVRILCWIGTYAKAHHLKAVHVKATWGRHCNKLLIFSETEDARVPTVKVDAPGDRGGLWAKTVHAFKLIEREHLHDYDWFLKADDDSYVIVENLRRMLLPYDPADPLFFGCHYMQAALIKTEHMTGSGYVLSREAVRRLVQEGFSGQHSNDSCYAITAKDDEDALISMCLNATGVQFGDSRDERGRPRFSHNPIQMYVGEIPEYHHRVSVWPMRKGHNKCCSDHPVTFHHMTADQLYMMEYFVYHLNVVPVTEITKNVPPKTKRQPKTKVSTRH